MLKQNTVLKLIQKVSRCKHISFINFYIVSDMLHAVAQPGSHNYINYNFVSVD